MRRSRLCLSARRMREMTAQSVGTKRTIHDWSGSYGDYLMAKVTVFPDLAETVDPSVLSGHCRRANVLRAHAHADHARRDAAQERKAAEHPRGERWPERSAAAPRHIDAAGSASAQPERPG